MKYPSLIFGIGLLVAPFWFVPDRESSILLTETPAVSASADCGSAKGVARVVCLADAFKATLTSEQLAVAQLTYSKTDAAKWSNFPEFGGRPLRVGIKLGALNATQLKAAKALMGAVMAQNVPNEGYDELEGNLAADDYFGTTTGKTGTFTSGNFFLALLGNPSTTGLWELQFGGHHYAFANTYNGGKVTGVTPSFRGVEPQSTITLNNRTYQPMGGEQQAFTALLNSLNETERNTAKLSATFRDVLLGPGRDGQFPNTKQGIRVGDLSAAQKTVVLNAIKLYVNDLDPATAAPVLANYTANLAETYVAYSGSGTMNQTGDYVRIDGPNVWIEYSNQPSRDFPGTTHPHSVWRDRMSDYGSK